MLESFSLLRNVGKFDSVSAGASLKLEKMALVHAENGRGKTTLATILRSLSSGDATLVEERKRLSAQHPPHVVIGSKSGPFIFQNAAWNASISNLVVFDDEFVSQNVSSGPVIEAGHRQRLHELILGAEGVRLNGELLKCVAAVENHNATLRRLEADIPASLRGSLSIDEFCSLPPQHDIVDLIAEAKRQLSIAESAQKILNTSEFSPIGLPSFNIEELESILSRTVSDLNGEVVIRLRDHFLTLGDRAEEWVGEGMERVRERHPVTNDCPFCLQDLAGSELYPHYGVYFGEAYEDLKARVAEAIEEVSSIHSGDERARFERAIAASTNLQRQWGSYFGVPQSAIDTSEIGTSWRNAREAVLRLLRSKQNAPLQKVELNEEVRAAIRLYHESVGIVAALSEVLQSLNADVSRTKEAAKASDIAALKSDVSRLEQIQMRQSAIVDAKCAAYLKEVAAKKDTEALREAARTALDAHREVIFPRYQTRINDYLGRFNTGFRVSKVKSLNQRTGTTSSYAIEIDGNEVSLHAGRGEPSFRNTLSAGDRSSLALAFFFASLEERKDLEDLVVVIDDPMTSLDEHRSLATVHEIVQMSDRVSQVIVLSHSKPFLGELWLQADKDRRSAIIVIRDGQGSTLANWDVNTDLVTEHDKRCALVRGYLQKADLTRQREVAGALRPMLESFCRVAYSDWFPPPQLLGPFLHLAQQRLGKPDQILSGPDAIELGQLIQYANRFHHDTNPTGYRTDKINDLELLGFAKRVLAFIRRP